MLYFQREQGVVHRPEPEHIREETEARQRATVWPDTLSAGCGLDSFLWKGDPKAKPVQRVGLAVFAVMLLLPAVGILAFMFMTKDWVVKLECLLIGSVALIAGLRLARNVFRK
jgi:hypothetical protein